MFEYSEHDGAGRDAIAGALQPWLPEGKVLAATLQLRAPISPILNGVVIAPSGIFSPQIRPSPKRDAWAPNSSATLAYWR